MVAGIGADLLKKSRLVQLPAEAPFFRKAYTVAEQAEAEGRDRPLDYFCSRFSGKEAVMKAMRADPDHVRLNEIEILTGRNGRPYVTLQGGMAALAAERGITRVEISLSGETDYVLAFAVALTDRAEEE